MKITKFLKGYQTRLENPTSSLTTNDAFSCLCETVHIIDFNADNISTIHVSMTNFPFAYPYKSLPSHWICQHTSLHKA